MYDLIKIHPVGAELFHADRGGHKQLDGHDEANSRFSQFCELANIYLNTRVEPAFETSCTSEIRQWPICKFNKLFFKELYRIRLEVVN